MEVSLETYQKWAFSETRFLLGFSDLRFSEDASRSRNGSSRSRKGRAISDARPSAQKGTHAMERESRPSDSDHTMRSVLSPLRPPVPDLGNKTPEEHLTDFFTEYDDHKDFMRARGVHGSARYKALLKLHNKPDAECSDRELRLKKLTKSPQEHLDFSREYDDHGDFKKARGVDKSARYMALLRLNNKPDYECSERELELKELWEGNKTPEEYLSQRADVTRKNTA